MNTNDAATITVRTAQTIALSLTILACGCASASRYGIEHSTDDDLCAAVASALAAEKSSLSQNICEWRFAPVLRGGVQLSSPVWTSYDITTDDVQRMRAIRAIYYENATEEQVREIWRRKYESKWKKSRKENAFEYKLSSFDIDNDGVVEDVLMEVRTECSKNWMLPSSPRIFVLDKKTDRIDPRYGVWESNVLNPFFYRGKTYFARMYFSSHARDASADDEVSNSQYKPLARVIEIVSPVKPGKHNPFLYSKPVCPFNFHK